MGNGRNGQNHITPLLYLTGELRNPILTSIGPVSRRHDLGTQVTN